MKRCRVICVLKKCNAKIEVEFSVEDDATKDEIWKVGILAFVHQCLDYLMMPEDDDCDEEI